MENSIRQELAKVQNSLKKEKVIETLTEARIKILNQQLCENFDEILAKRKLYMYMLSYYQDFYTKTIDPIFFSSLFDSRKTLQQVKSSAPRNTLNHIMHFRKNISILSRTVNFLAGNRADLINILTYSTIPSMFGLLTQYNEQKLYLKFIEELIEANKMHESKDDKKDFFILFARSIFLIPEFMIFIQAIADQVSVQFCKIQGTALAEQFLSEFLVNAEKFIHLCPPIIGKIANKIYSYRIINESFFQEIIRNPLYFGFVQIGESEYISEGTSIVLSETATRSNFIENLTNILLKSRKNDHKNAYSEVAKNITAYQSVYYATTYDVQLINVLASLAKVGELAVPEDLPTEYGLNIFQDTIIVSPSQVEDLTSKDKKDPVISAAENSLRSLLTCADPMPMIDHPHLSSFLQINLIDQVPSHISQKQYAYFSILKSCKNLYQHNIGKKTPLEEFIKILIPNIKSQKKVTTLASSQKLQNYTTSLTQMHYAKRKITDLLTEKKFEISYIALSICFNNHEIKASGKAFVSKSGLINHFKDLENAWIAFAKQTHFTADIPKEMLLATMLKIYKYDNMMFLDKNKLIKMDKLFIDSLSGDYDINQSNKELDNLFKNESQKLKHAVDLMDRAFKVQSTLLAMKLISALFESIKKVLNEVIGTPGMEELTPTLLYVAYSAKPPNFISKTEYFYRVFQSISEYTKVDEYQEYVVNTLHLHQTAFYFFRNTKPNPLENDTFMNS